VMLEKELQSVLKTLRGAGINVVAIHNHIETESPRICVLTPLGDRLNDRSRERIESCAGYTKK